VLRVEYGFGKHGNSLQIMDFGHLVQLLALPINFWVALGSWLSLSDSLSVKWEGRTRPEGQALGKGQGGSLESSDLLDSCTARATATSPGSIYPASVHSLLGKDAL
jgi:hypothetical protein